MRKKKIMERIDFVLKRVDEITAERLKLKEGPDSDFRHACDMRLTLLYIKGEMKEPR